MKLFFLAIIFSILTAACAQFNTEAQIRSSNSGKISDGNVKPATPNPNSFDISTVDFNNFTFPDFGNENPQKTFTLKNGIWESKKGFPVYTLRKTYYFDLTGDRQNEAVSHIITDGCQPGCETSNLFYVHTAKNKQPKLLWKIATGNGLIGGLKAANFKSEEITFEVFGDSFIEDLVIKPNIDLKKNPKLQTTIYTRFVFSLVEDAFIQTARDVLPLSPNINLDDFRTKISFGDMR